MSDAIAEKERRAFALTPWSAACIAFGAGAALLFLFFGIRYANETQEQARLIPYLNYDQRLDFNYFYGAAQMVRHGDADELYPDCRPGNYPECSQLIIYPGHPLFRDPSIDDYTKAKAIVTGSYFAPPGDAYVQAPLAWLSFRSAYFTWSALSLVALAGFAVFAATSARRVPEMPFLIAGVLAFRPVHETLIMGHLALFFLLAVAGGFLLLRANKPELAGLTLSLLALKPQWAILPALFLLVRGERRALAVMLVASAVVFFVPFFAAGIDTLPRYLRFVKDVAGFNLQEAPHMLSWNGFLFKLNGEPVDKLLYYVLLVISLVPMAYVWWKRDFYLGAAAAITAMLLVNNHSVWYDWSLLAAAALFLVLRTPSMTRGQRIEMWVVLLVLYLAAGQSIGELIKPDRHFIDWYREAVYTLAPVALVALSWMASLAYRDARRGSLQT